MNESRFRPSLRGSTPSIAEELQRQAHAVAATGEKVIYLNVGQPGTSAPVSALDALAARSRQDVLGYCGAGGLSDLKARIARSYDELYGVTVAPSRVIVTIGASGAIILALIGCFDNGARIALPQPFYYAYRRVMGTLGVDCVPFYPSMENHFQPTVADLEAIEGDIDGVIFASPGNPSGSMMSPEQMAEVADYCARRQIRLISDEIYHGITYDDEVPTETAVKFSHEAIAVNSFSKYYSMPGWRLGWMVVPEYLAESISNLAHNLYISPSAPSQIVGLHAMDCRDELDEHVARYRINRDILVRELPKVGFDRFTAPHGAFYIYAHVRHLHEDSVQFTLDMLHGCGVLAAPGADFSPRDGDQYMRFSYAGPTADIEEAVTRLKKWRH